MQAKNKSAKGACPPVPKYGRRGSASGGKSKIIFFGTSEFAVPSLKALLQEGYHVVLVVTMPDKPAGRKQILTPSAIKVEAQKLKLEVVDNLKDLKFPSASLGTGKIKEINPAIGIVAAYGKIIPKNIIDSFLDGCINIHPSLLPKYRGPSPIQSAILNGDKKTGVTIIKLDEKMDHGDRISCILYPVSSSDTYESLSKKLADEGAKLLVKTLPDYFSKKIKLEPQNDSQATFTKILKREDGKIDWHKSAKEIERQIRAYYPWPGSYSLFENRKSQVVKVKILSAQSTNDQFSAKPGSFQTKNGQLYIQCHKGSLLINRLQPEGKKEMTAQEFINGYLT